MRIECYPTELVAEHLRSNLSYDPDTGEFRCIVARAIRVHIGDIAGYINCNGYRMIRITINGVGFQLLAHRLAWLYVYGVWPKCGLDHIDRNRSNNRISNLREATQKQNTRNRTKQENATSRYMGVHWCKRDKKWIASIRINGNRCVLGYFDTEEQAALAYNAAAIVRDPAFNNLNIVPE